MCPGNSEILHCFYVPKFYKIFQTKKTWKELYDEYPCIHCIDSQIDNLLYLLDPISSHIATELGFDDHVKVLMLTKSNLFLKSITFACANNAFVLKVLLQAK